MKHFILFISGNSKFCHHISYDTFEKVLDILLANKQDYTIEISYSRCCDGLTTYINRYCSDRRIDSYGTTSSMTYIKKMSISGITLFSVNGRLGAVAEEINEWHQGNSKRIINLNSNGTI